MLRYVVQFGIFLIEVFSINETFITLILKMASVSTGVDFRPISLCNVMYKLVSKVLANRLKLVLSSITSQHQSTFVPGRLITDNILIAFEALHTMNSRMSGKKGLWRLRLTCGRHMIGWSVIFLRL